MRASPSSPASPPAFAVAFLARPASLLTRAIHLVAGSPTHVELQFSDGRTFTAAAGRGAYWTDGLSARAVWHVVPVAELLPPAAQPDLVEREHSARALCGAFTGVGYDYLGALGFRVGFDQRDRVQCAEIVALGLVAAGLPPDLMRRAATPRALYRALQDRREAIARAAAELAAERAPSRVAAPLPLSA